ncbi:MAG TPA: Crp/Fnr family transcriptional regulator [Acidobacteriota bacterium]|nr:Crp/Fnr family transcriptional regulator [Acidobacteriota bacterium]
MASSPIQDDSLIRADRMWHLKRSSLVGDVSDQEIEAIAEACTDQIYPRGAQIFQEGDPVRYLYILNRGYVQLSVGKEAPRQKVLRILKGGEVFGEEILGRQTAHQATATAYRECWASLLPREKLLELIRFRPALSLNLIRILTHKLWEARTDLQDGALDARQRVAKTLLRLGDLHGQPIYSEKRLRKLSIPISHRRLAAIIGGCRPHISAILSEFKKSGMLEYQGRKMLLDMESLRQSLQGEQPEPLTANRSA